MALICAGYYLPHFSFILFNCFYSSHLFPSDETEYEYSGSEEEDEERDMGEPRSVSAQMYKHRHRPEKHI